MTTDWKPCPEGFHCHKCAGKLEFEKYESYDGAYEDYHYRCLDCHYSWWVDGADS